MKKLVAIAFLISFSGTVFAQVLNTQAPPPPPKKAKFKGGVMINPAISWLSANVDNSSGNNNSISSKNAQLEFSYGLLGEFFFNNNYGISTNLRVTGYNTEFKYYPTSSSMNNTTLSIDRTLHMQYIELPITLKMRTNEVGYMKYFAQFGFMPSVKIGAREDFTESGPGSNNQSGSNINVAGTTDINLFMLYSVLGVGAEYNLGGTTSLVFSITWNNGFTNIWHKSPDDLSTNPQIFSNFNTPQENIALNIGVLF